jgi:hypothetical protein
MAGFYQSILGIAVAVMALGLGVVIAVQQLLASQVSHAVARLPLRSLLLSLGLAVSVLGVGLASAGALLLAGPHDLLPIDLSSNELLADPLTGAVCLIALGVGGVLTVWSGLRSLQLLNLTAAAKAIAGRQSADARAKWVIAGQESQTLVSHDLEAVGAGGLDPIAGALLLHQVNTGAISEIRPRTRRDEQAARRLEERLKRRRDLSRRLIEMRSAGRLEDPFSPLLEIVDVAARTGRPEVVEAVTRDVILAGGRPHRSTSLPITAREVVELVNAEVLEDRLPLLIQRWADRGDYAAVAACSRGSTVAGQAQPGRWPSALALSINASQMLLRRPAASALCSVIRDLEAVAITSLEWPEDLREGIFDESCRAIGNLGEQVPSIFCSPDDPEVLLTPDTLRYEAADPLGCVLDALHKTQEAAFRGSEVRVDALIWRDAVTVTAKAIAHRSATAFKDDRLEMPLVSAMLLLARLGAVGARSGDERRAMIAAFDLEQLAEDADKPFYHEYPGDIALALVEIGIFAFEHALTSSDGRPLADQIAESLASKLPSHLSYPMHEALVAGRFSPATHDARWAFIKKVGVKVGDNFGFRFDPVTGADHVGTP